MSSIELMLSLSRAAIMDEKLAIPSDYRIDWDRLLDVSATHGTLAWVWDSVYYLPKEQRPSRLQSINWGLSAQEIWDTYHHQESVLKQVVSVCNNHEIRLLLLKGIGLSKLYPKPESRSCGDIDIFLFQDFDKGNQLFCEDGSIIETALHASFCIQNVNVENHKMLIFPNTKTKKAVGQYLQCHLNDVELAEDGYYLLSPLPNLAYLLMHALNHFNYSIDTHVISVRNILDLAVFIYSNKKYLNPEETFDVLHSIYLDRAFEMIVYLSEWLLKVDLSEYHKGLVKQRDIDKIERVIFEDGDHRSIERMSMWEKSTLLWKRFFMLFPLTKYVPRKPKNGLFYRVLKTQYKILRGKKNWHFL